MRNWIILFLCLLNANVAFGGALDPWATWAAAQPSTSKQIPPAALVARGVGTNTYYVIEVDPTNGQIPVSATVSFAYDENYGTPGASTLRTASMLGVGSTAVSNANPVPISDAGGSITVDATNLNIRALDDATDYVRIGDGTHRVVVSTGGALSVNDANFPTTVDTNSGAASASTLRTVLATRHEAVATPLAVQLSNGTSAVDYGSGASGTATQRVVLATRHETMSTPLAVESSNGTNSVAFDTGASGVTVPRVVLATRHEAVATPLAVQLSNGTNAVAYDTGASGATVPRVVLATRHEAAASPISVRLSDGTNFGTASLKGRTYADSARNAYASTSVTTGAWVQLIASTAATINCLTLFDSSGQTLELGTGAAASETRQLIIPPGGLDGCTPLLIASGTRVSVRAVSATASSGEIDLTGMN